MNPAGSFTPPTVFNQDIGMGWEYVRITNSSPYKLTVSLGNQGSRTLPEMFLEDVSLTRAFNGKVVITPVAMMSAGSIANALTNYVQLDVFGQDELRHPQAQPLTTMANVGNSLPLQGSTTSIVNDGNIAGTQIVEASIGGITHRLDTNSGDITLKKDTTSANQAMINLVDLKVGGKQYSEFLMTDGSLLIQETVGGIFVFQVYPDGHLIMQNWSTTAAGAVTFNQGITSAGGTLIGGVQESGHFTTNFSSPLAMGYSFWIRFRQTMTNTPSSITLSNITTANITGTPTAVSISKDGFQLNCQVTSTNTITTVILDWVTVGN